MNLFPARAAARALLLLALLALAGCATPHSTSFSSSGGSLNIRNHLLPPGVHGRQTGRTMHPRFITIHSTENPGATAEMHAHYLLSSGKRSRRNPRSNWVEWHYTVDDIEVAQHLLPTEQGDHADYAGQGDRESIGIEICEFRDPRRQAEAIVRAARLAASLADQFGIPTSNIVPHKHWPRFDFPYGKPCPRILLERDRSTPGGWRLGEKWSRFLGQVQHYR
jgi:N-acetylmuramoyl-L-alanine amidase